MQSAKTFRGFTLSELLTVLAIVAVLCTILLPVVSQARRSGGKTMCVANLHNIGLAIAAYSQDYDARYPIGLDCLNGSYDNVSPYLAKTPAVLAGMPLLKDVLKPYVGEDAIWHCPSDVGAESVPLSTISGERRDFGATPTAFDALGTSYAYRLRFALSGSHFPAGCYIENETGSAQEWDVTRCPIVTEFRGWHGDEDADAFGPTTARYNILFADGHIKNEGEGFVVGATVCYPL